MPNILSPMLVQYLVGLCCLKWDKDAVEVTIGDMVLDEAARKKRDVDVTVTVKENGRVTRAFKAYEVKREGKPLDVVATEGLCIKLLDMPGLTHRAIVSSSGFTDGARAKADKHGIELFEIKPWVKPLEDQFPLLEMRGTIQECFPSSLTNLCWPQYQVSLIARKAKGTFQVQPSDTLFSAKGGSHPKYKTYDAYLAEILLRSTEVLFPMEPAATVLRTFHVPFSAPTGEIPAGPAWPHTHTLDVSADGVYVETESGKIALDLVTISGFLHWQRDTKGFDYQIIESVSGGEAFAGALVSVGHRAGQMTCLVFSPKTRRIGIEFVQLADRHKNSIRNLQLRIEQAG